MQNDNRNSDAKRNPNESHEDHKHEGGRGGNVQGQGDRQTQKQAQSGKMPFNGLDYEEQRKRATEQGSGGNKKSENQAQQSETDSINKEMD